MNSKNSALLFALACTSFPIVITIELFATTKYLGGLSYCLLLIMITLNLSVARNGLALNPYSIFSFMYSGFGIGGLYYSFSDGYFGKFLEFIPLNRDVIELHLILSQAYAILCFLFFSIGYISFYKKYFELNINKFGGMSIFIKSNYKLISFPLLVFGFFYWVWVSNKIAGGVFDALIIFQVFPHLVEDARISIAPYLFYYSGVYIYMMGRVINREKLGLKFWLASFTGFVISASTARLAISVTFLLAQLYILYLLFPDRRNLMVRVTMSLFITAFIFYFLRVASNLYFLGQDFNLSEMEIVSVFIGDGNVTDLQQLVILFTSLIDRPSGLGITYFDWIRNTFGGYFGVMPSSIGLIIKDQFISENSGAPTPTAIGEAFYNFYISAPIFMFFIGMILAYINNFAGRRISILSVFIYSSFVVNFVFLYPKVDSTMFANFFWGVAPTLMVLILSYLLFILVKQSCRKKPFDLNPLVR